MSPKLLDTVALVEHIRSKGLVRGQVGTIVELLEDAYEVEFSDDNGRAYATVALAVNQFLLSHQAQ
jgi:Domain of unknown function (DUF4926)